MPDGTLGPTFDFASVFAGVLATVGLGLLVGYVFFAVVLMTLAIQTRTPGAGLAWLPIANMYLLCKIGRRSGAWMLLLFVPVINIFAIAVLWASVAGARGKPSWAGPLVLLPPFTLLIPIYLMLGKQPKGGPAASARCAGCGVPAVPGERFCGECGRPLPMMPPWPSFIAGISAAKAAGVALVMLVLIAGTWALVGWQYMGRSIAYVPPADRQAPDVPENLAGTMREFPIDTDPTAPATADSVITQDFRATTTNGVPEEPKVPEEWLPPGIDRKSLPQQASTMTSAAYDTRGENPGEGSSPPPPGLLSDSAGASADGQTVYVHVLTSSGDPRREADDYARSIVQAIQGQRTGIEVSSPLGESYTGSKIRTEQVTVYILVKQRSPVVVLLYAPRPAAANVADRLARNLGNGRGPSDYPGGRTILSVLPANPPDGLLLKEVNAVTPERMGLSAAKMHSTFNASHDAATEQKLAQLLGYLPRRIVHARFADMSRNDYDTIILDYGTPRAAYNLWLPFRYTVGASQFESATVLGQDGRHADNQDRHYLLFQKGPYLVILQSPRATALETLIRLGNSLQM